MCHNDIFRVSDCCFTINLGACVTNQEAGIFSLKEMLVIDPNLFSKVLKSKISLFKSVYLPE